MGVYLNSRTAYTLYKKETEQPYFVDKTQMLQELFPLVKQGNNQICITRPRRFGKTVMANMISSFFSKGCDAGDIFRKLQISKIDEYEQYQNQYSVIHISFNKLPRQCDSYREYINRIERILIKDLKEAYPEVEVDETEAVWDVLMSIYAINDTAQFIFILDEWDFIFHQDFVTNEDKKEYLSFLRDLLKDMPYVVFAYMTGILPIAKYSSGSELNMFVEFTMAKAPAFSDYFGFTEAEVSGLFKRYMKICKDPGITQEGLRVWYNGYHTAAGERVYNPRSVVLALQYNHLENYWTSAGPYDEIFSAMVVYGFLSYENGKVSIPNQELIEVLRDAE